jgi:methionyl-tRNA formyltransferase
MSIVIIRRAGWLFRAAELLLDAGETIAAVITAKDSDEATVGPEEYQRLASSCHASFFRSVNASREDILDKLAKTRPDLCLTVNFPGT